MAIITKGNDEMKLVSILDKTLNNYIAVIRHENRPNSLEWSRLAYSKTAVGLNTAEYNKAMSLIASMVKKMTHQPMNIEIEATDSVGVFTNAYGDPKI